jgi:hypothetical protein
MGCRRSRPPKCPNRARRRSPTLRPRAPKPPVSPGPGQDSETAETPAVEFPVFSSMNRSNRSPRSASTAPFWTSLVAKLPGVDRSPSLVAPRAARPMGCATPRTAHARTGTTSREKPGRPREKPGRPREKRNRAARPRRRRRRQVAGVLGCGTPGSRCCPIVRRLISAISGRRWRRTVELRARW